MDWDDLKYLLAVADGGSLEAAAQSLKVKPHEVSQHITKLENALNCELLARTDAGVTITVPGQRVVAAARAVAAQLATLAQDVGGVHGELSGRLCVTSTAGFVPRAMKAFEPLRDKYPALRIETMVSSHVVDLHRKEADLAVRMFKDQQDGLAMKKLGTMGWSLYASERYLAGHPAGASLLDGHKVIAYDSSFSNTAGGRWIAANVPEDAIAVRVNGLRQAFDAAASGQGACVVPCHLASEHKVVRMTKDVLTSNDVYAVFLSDRSNEPRLRVVIDALVDLFEREQASFAGT